MTRAPRLQHVLAPGYGQRNIHYLSLNGQETLCGHMPMYQNEDGTNIIRLFNTVKPVTCKSCLKAMELTIRHTLTRIKDSEKLEDIYSVVFEAVQSSENGASTA